MGSRYSSAPRFDYCYHPLHVIDGDKDLFVPCGKCNGCLLHRANVWSMRVGAEIEATPNSIFFTLTYSNKYLPVAKVINRVFRPDGSELVTYTFNHSDNIRFNGVRDVERYEDLDDFTTLFESVPITHYDLSFPDRLPFDYLAYSSKRDVQLWLKILRKDLNLYFNGNKRLSSFRYFIISEYGETKFRPHLHGVIFPSSYEQAEYLLKYSLYKNWKMCDENQFYPYAHYCDSGAKGYITQYLTCFDCLPKVYKKNKGIRPFRLASKAPAIGYIVQSKETLFQAICRGTVYYSKTVSRLGVDFVLRFPSDYVASVFPKCYQFSQLSFQRISSLYGCILSAYRRRNDWKEFGISFDSLLTGFRENLHPMNYNSALCAFRICTEFDIPLQHYLWLFDEYYYLSAMDALRSWYLFQSENPPLVSLATYSTSMRLFRDSNPLAFSYFLESYGLSDKYVSCSLDDLQSLVDESRFVFHQHYRGDVDDIIKDMVKLPKFREIVSQSPVSNF